MNMENLAYIPTLIGKVVSSFWVKFTGSFVFISYTFFFDSLHFQALIALFFLIMADFVFGLAASFRTGVEIKSAKILRSALKIVIYFAMVSVGFLAETAGLGFLPIDETIIGFLAVTELISILENVANMGYGIPLRLLNKLKKYKDTK